MQTKKLIAPPVFNLTPATQTGLTDIFNLLIISPTQASSAILSLCFGLHVNDKGEGEAIFWEMKFEGISRYTGFFIVIAVLIASSIMCAQSFM